MSVCSCGREWHGLAECHCGSCHEHFGSLAGFDMHRVAGRCMSAAEMLGRTTRTGRAVPMAQVKGRYGFNWVTALRSEVG